MRKAEGSAERQRRKHDGIEALKQSILLDPGNLEDAKTDTDLRTLRETPEGKHLLGIR